MLRPVASLLFAPAVTRFMILLIVSLVEIATVRVATRALSPVVHFPVADCNRMAKIAEQIRLAAATYPYACLVKEE